jgi:hypothetical protein
MFSENLCEDRACGSGSHNSSYFHHFWIPNLCRGVFFSLFRGSFLYYKPVVGFSPFSPPVGVTALGAIGSGQGGHPKIRSRMRFLLVLYIILIRVHSFNCLRSIFWLSSSTPLRMNGQSYIFPCLLNSPLAIYLPKSCPLIPHPRRQRHQRLIILSFSCQLRMYSILIPSEPINFIVIVR